MEVPVGVATAALQWFDDSAVCGKKHPTGEWTVLAAIVLQTQPQRSTDATSSDIEGSFRVLAVGTGNKCLGQRELNADGLVVNDCHAEILARRAFLRYLYAEALVWRRGSQAESQSNDPTRLSIFERHPVTQRLVLKPEHSLHLYVSEAPCGDAAIYELREDVVDELVQQRAAREQELDGSNKTSSKSTEQEIERSALRLTGAKSNAIKRSRASVSPSDAPQPPEKRFQQQLGIARVKSGRSDLPFDKRTLSMSCSDKLAKWNALGLQGLLLLQWFEPVYLHSIVVSEDERALSATKQTQALERAVCTRLQERRALDSPTCCKATVVSTDMPFSRRRNSNAAPSSLALNWTLQEPHWASTISTMTISAPKTTHKPGPPSASARLVHKFFGGSDIEVLMAGTGLKQGAKKASKMDSIAMERVASRLAKRTLLRAFHLVLETDSVLMDAAKGLGYQELKLRVPLAGSTSPPSSNAMYEVRDRRKCFRAAFNDWIGVPETFKQFKV